MLLCKCRCCIYTYIEEEEEKQEKGKRKNGNVYTCVQERERARNFFLVQERPLGVPRAVYSGVFLREKIASLRAGVRVRLEISPSKLEREREGDRKGSRCHGEGRQTTAFYNPGRPLKGSILRAGGTRDGLSLGSGLTILSKNVGRASDRSRSSSSSSSRRLGLRFPLSSILPPPPRLGVYAAAATMEESEKAYPRERDPAPRHRAGLGQRAQPDKSRPINDKLTESDLWLYCTGIVLLLAIQRFTGESRELLLLHP